MKYQIRKTDWFKRRTPTKTPQPIDVNIEGYVQVNSHKCDSMVVTFDNGEVLDFTGWVIRNDIKDTYAVHGYGHGKLIIADVIEGSK